MMTTAPSSLRGVSFALTAILAMSACGGGSAPSNPNPLPTPVATPTPDPTPEPTPQTSCSPLPPPVTRIRVVVHLKGPDYLTLDATPLVGPDVGYCASIGYRDGRSICPVRPEGDPQRRECEAYAVGRAEDTGRIGPTWTRNSSYCKGNACENHPDNQFLLWAYKNGYYEACVKNGTCGSTEVDR